MADAVKLDMDVNEAVDLWLAEDRAFHEGSGSVRAYIPRVLVRDGDAMVARRPFKRAGFYFVRWAGTARLMTAERKENGVIVFGVAWSW